MSSSIKTMIKQKQVDIRKKRCVNVYLQRTVYIDGTSGIYIRLQPGFLSGLASVLLQSAKTLRECLSECLPSSECSCRYEG